MKDLLEYLARGLVEEPDEVQVKEVQEDDAGLFAFDPIRRIDEWREAMLADPNHTRKFSKEDAIPIAKKFLSARGSIVSLKEIMSRFCGDQDVCENKCQY